MRQYKLEEIMDIRGYSALTQGEERIEGWLLGNINVLGGKKSLGFIKTRREFVSSEFDIDSLTEFLIMSIELVRNGIIGGANILLLTVGKDLCEKIFRDHVPMDMVETFMRVACELCDALGSIDKAVEAVEKYFTGGNVVPVAKTYMQAENCLEKGLEFGQSA